MGFKEAASSESAGLPLLPIESGKAGLRIRLLGEASAPALAGTKYADGTIEYWEHWIPNELSTALGGIRGSVPCVGVRDGCIFHAGDLNWRPKKSSKINVVWYKGWDPRKKTVEERVIVAYFGGLKIWQQIGAHAESFAKRPDELDFLISKTGVGRDDTVWAATPLPDLIDETIDLVDGGFEVQSEYADDDIPVILDFDKFPGIEITTPEMQQAWYDKLIKRSEGKPAATDTETGDAATAPAAAQVTMPTTATKGTRGRPSKEVLEQRKRDAEAAAKAPESAAAPAAARPAPPPPPGANNAALEAYNAALEIADPWGKPMGTTDQVDFILSMANDATQKATYFVTDDMVAAAKLVKAGPPAVAPPPPPSTARPTPPPPPATPAAAATAPAGEVDVEELKRELSGLTKASPSLGTFKGMRAFLDGPGEGAKSTKAIEDPDMLEKLIGICVQGETAIAAAIKPYLK